MPQVAGVGAPVPDLALDAALPGLDDAARLVAGLRHQEAGVDGHDLVPAAGPVEPERRPLLGLAERELELVAVAVGADRGDDRILHEVVLVPDPLQHVGDLLGLSTSWAE